MVAAHRRSRSCSSAPTASKRRTFPHVHAGVLSRHGVAPPLHGAHRRRSVALPGFRPGRTRGDGLRRRLRPHRERRRHGVRARRRQRPSSPPATSRRWRRRFSAWSRTDRCANASPGPVSRPPEPSPGSAAPRLSSPFCARAARARRSPRRRSAPRSSFSGRHATAIGPRSPPSRRRSPPSAPTLAAIRKSTFWKAAELYWRWRDRLTAWGGRRR